MTRICCSPPSYCLLFPMIPVFWALSALLAWELLGGSLVPCGVQHVASGGCGQRVQSSVLSAPPEVLEESHSGCVLPTSLGANSLKKSSWGFLFTGIIGGTLVAVYAVATPFLTPALRKICLPFVPATTKQIENVVKMLRCRRGSLVDIGSGDGRIVIAAAKAGFRAFGVELNPWLVWYSRYRAWREGVHGSAKFYVSDLWKVTFSQYSNIIIFGVPQMGPWSSCGICLSPHFETSQLKAREM
uniref:ATP synthase subunit C lysine N-methyltransferase isoform X4 n=2 Tax=Halichoerus grypus TaxID=9711 RepID=UPI001659FCAA|nr:ATP synthase subunit C lysine N-methyltransferase isoform X4 [Halichoerus grypus]XP_035960482.1 ATP synthase subunit C lysine N-methyltransferase isoform X4 [Halichoerus grypus]